MDWRQVIGMTVISSIFKSAWTFGIPTIKPSIVSIEDHDSEAFTQGLLFEGGKLFESTGLQDTSTLRRMSLGNPKPEIVINLKAHWAEGIAYADGEIVQLTWKSGLAFVYSYPDLELKSQYTFEGEGWGLASFEGGFVMTEGSDALIYRDREFEIIRKTRVAIRGVALKWLNDLVYANGHLYVNRLGDNNIYEIRPDLSKVTRIIDCSELVHIAAPEQPESYLNGIAYIAESDTFILTGKRWPKLFLVNIERRGKA